MSRPKKLSRGFTVDGPTGAEAAVEAIDLTQRPKCPYCNTPYCFGELGEGTNIEVKCSRCNKKFSETVLPRAPAEAPGSATAG